MGLKLTMGKGDLVLMSGGYIVFVDILDRDKASFLTVNSDGDITRLNSKSQSRDAHTIFPGTSFMVESVYFSEKMSCGQVKLNFVAPKKVRIHRLHRNDSEERIAEILAHFDGSGDLGALVKNVEKIAPGVLQ